MITIRVSACIIFFLAATYAAVGQAVLYSTRHDHLGLGWHDAIAYVEGTEEDYEFVIAMCNEGSSTSNGICVSLVTEAGDYEYTIYYGDTAIRYFPEYRGGSKLTDGRFVSAIEAYPDDSSSRAMIWMFDAWGDTAWTRTPYMTQGVNSLGERAFQSSSGNLMLTGQVSYPGQVSQVFLICYTPAGDELWREEFTGGGPWSKRVTSAEALSDGGAIIGACRVNWDYSDVDGWLIRTNSEGHVVWDSIVDTPYDDGGRGVITYSADKFAIAGMPLVQTGSYPPEDCCRRPYVAMLDTSGAVLWERTFLLTGTGMDLMTGLRDPADGGLIFTGSTYHQQYMNAFLFKVSAEGDSLWYHEYYLPDSSCVNHGYIPFSMEIEPSGHIVLAGQAGFCGEDQWMMRTDGEGTPPPTMWLWTDVQEPMDRPTTGISAYPNPVVSDVALKLTSGIWIVSIADARGRVVIRHAPLGNTQVVHLDLTSLVAGPYIARLMDETGQQYSVIIVKE